MTQKKMKAPDNTAKAVSDNPILGLFTALGEGGRGILAQEDQGQESFVRSETLPTNMSWPPDYNTKAILEAAGVKFLGVVDGDDIFQYVKLPEGWKKEPTHHSMWSNLVDDKGRVRALIFYKATFYDRSAHLELQRRFDVKQDYDKKKENVAVTHVTDGGKVIHTTGPIPLPEDDYDQKCEVLKEVKAKAITWLDENYPDWRDPGAYWD
jgi:hypothetical protein